MGCMCGMYVRDICMGCMCGMYVWDLYMGCRYGMYVWYVYMVYTSVGVSRVNSVSRHYR